MGRVLDWLRKKLGVRIITDPVFGRLVYDRNGCWEGEGEFLPTGDRVTLFVQAGNDGPGQAQRRAFHRIAEGHPKWRPAAEAAAHAALTEWFATGGTSYEPAPLHLVLLDIPEAEDPQMEWEANFYSDVFRNRPLLSVTMQGWVARRADVLGT
ncbi:MAG: hypothetical protein L0216_05510 [Planctomycetales bacterium]|nr:hypothetical protein [Planctomycetales bacterium]